MFHFIFHLFLFIFFLFWLCGFLALCSFVESLLLVNKSLAVTICTCNVLIPTIYWYTYTYSIYTVLIVQSLAVTICTCHVLIPTIYWYTYTYSIYTVLIVQLLGVIHYCKLVVYSYHTY
jgi:hypothetical protein